MAYRNGTYIAFHAEGKTDPTASDIKYYRTMKMWHENDDIDFQFVNSHDKAAAVRDSSLNQTLKRSLLERLRNSKNFVLIIGDKTRFDADWVPFEISRAVDDYGLPIIAVYTGVTGRISNPSNYAHLWPQAFKTRVENGTVGAIHIPFRQKLIDKAIRQFDVNNLPKWPNTIYNDETYTALGL